MSGYRSQGFRDYTVITSPLAHLDSISECDFEKDPFYHVAFKKWSSCKCTFKPRWPVIALDNCKWSVVTSEGDVIG